MDNEVKVSIFCFVYNHEDNLSRCLDGFVNQNTNFKFEAIIHDDCSTDDSKKIIENYQKKYPKIIVPIYEETNQYSKGTKIGRDIMMPLAKGKYIAFCEGDDYWCDNNKLQKQYDYLEEHPECSLCTHNTKIHDCLNKNKDTTFNDWNEIHKLTDIEVFKYWKVHTSSYMIRKNYNILPVLKHDKCYGDYKELVFSYYYGEIVSLPYIMSVYNYNNNNGMIRQLKKSNIEIEINTLNNRIQFLNDYNHYTNLKFNSAIQETIDSLYIKIYMLKISKIKSVEEFKNQKNMFKNNKIIIDYIRNKNIINRMYFKLLFSNYLFFIILKKLKNATRKFYVWRGK